MNSPPGEHGGRHVDPEVARHGAPSEARAFQLTNDAPWPTAGHGRRFERGARYEEQNNPSEAASTREKKQPARKEWMLRLYTQERERPSMARGALEMICETHLAGRYQIEVINLMEQPQLARGDQIVALPTLVRRLPPPMKKIIGDLSDEESVLVGLDLRALPRRPRMTK